jgi:hypothetical protein
MRKPSSKRGKRLAKEACRTWRSRQVRLSLTPAANLGESRRPQADWLKSCREEIPGSARAVGCMNSGGKPRPARRGSQSGQVWEPRSDDQPPFGPEAKFEARPSFPSAPLNLKKRSVRIKKRRVPARRYWNPSQFGCPIDESEALMSRRPTASYRYRMRLKRLFRCNSGPIKDS